MTIVADHMNRDSLVKHNKGVDSHNISTKGHNETMD